MNARVGVGTIPVQYFLNQGVLLNPRKLFVVKFTEAEEQGPLRGDFCFLFQPLYDGLWISPQRAETMDEIAPYPGIRPMSEQPPNLLRPTHLEQGRRGIYLPLG